MNISGVLVTANPDKINIVKQQLTEISGLEIHAVAEDGRLVITLECDNDKTMADTVIEINNCEGVSSAVITYQYGNENENLDEEIPV
ncbi:chaperone NapD [Candidatus Halobeggiatoa sp. HSG11]|nr:chaperone NapD [Candidatus Halobeggiatoa sp. HSG11]